jgi:hypothetical protein
MHIPAIFSKPASGQPEWRDVPLVQQRIDHPDAPVPLPETSEGVAYKNEFVPAGTSFDDAVALAAQRAKTVDVKAWSQHSPTAQGVLQGRDGKFYVTTVGSRFDDRVSPTAIDGPIRSRNQPITMTRTTPDMKAVVGGETWVDFSHATDNAASPAPLPSKLLANSPEGWRYQRLANVTWEAPTSSYRFLDDGFAMGNQFVAAGTAATQVSVQPLDDALRAVVGLDDVVRFPGGKENATAKPVTLQRPAQ